MKSYIGAKPFIFPQPVLLVGTYDKNDVPDIMNVAYGGIVNSNRLQINIGVRHKTSDNIKNMQEFTVGLATENIITAADYVGMVSGHEEPDKVKKSGLHINKSEHINAPVIEESPITLECRVEEIRQFDKTLRIIAEIIDVLVDDSIEMLNGHLDISRANIASYDPDGNLYYRLGDEIGHAFLDGKQLM